MRTYPKPLRWPCELMYRNFLSIRIRDPDKFIRTSCKNVAFITFPLLIPHSEVAAFSIFSITCIE